MKPPICEVCGDRFDPDDGALVTFAGSLPEPAQTDPKRVGHPSNVGWFCGEHAAAARQLATSTLGVALAALRPVRTPAPRREPEPAPVAEQVTPPGRRPRRDNKLIEVEPEVSIDVFDLHERLLEFRPTLMATLGLPDDIDLTTHTARTWNPMDGSREPNCPYTDRVSAEAKHAGIEQSVEVESNWWNPDELDNASARLYIVRRAVPDEWGQHVCRISGSTEHLRGAHPIVRVLRIGHEGDPTVARCIDDFVATLRSPE